MGIQASKTLQRKPSRTKSNLSEKVVSSEEISQFASQLNHLVTINLENDQDKFDYLVFKKIPLTGKFAPLSQCSNISHTYDSVFVCYDCSNDPHAYICEPCFEKGNHEGHRFSVFTKNAGWSQLYCRCGDYQFMKKNTICEKHKEVKMMPKVITDDKDRKKFSLYFHQIFKTIFSLLKKKRGAQSLLNAFFMYLEKSTQNNLGFSKMLCEFLLEKNSIDGQTSNLAKLIQMTRITDTNFFRNLNFVTEYKLDILREIILALNQNADNVQYLSELIINYAGKMELLDKLAKEENLILGSRSQNKIWNKKFNKFYDKIISQNFTINETWKCIIRNKLVKNYINHDNVIKSILHFLYEEKDQSKQIVYSFLQQLLECQIGQSKQYIIPCLMIIAPDCFFVEKPIKQKPFDKKTQAMLFKYYQKIFSALSTNNSSQEFFDKNFLLLPFFSFGESAINSFWEQIDRRINVFDKSKQKAIIKQSSMNIFLFLTKILNSFFQWQHLVVQEASKNNFKSFSENKKLIEKLLKQCFFKQKKIPRINLLEVVDQYTQKQRSLATESIKKYLRYNPRKAKYYYVGDKLQNNFFDFQQLKLGFPAKLSEWQQFVHQKVFTQNLYKILPRLIKIAQRGLMQDISMVKMVSNISIAVTLLNKSQKATLKNVTRKFIKEIPDVNEDVYYILAGIRDRMELDIDDVEEQGMRGRKKQKLDLIAEIRDKKYRAIKEKQDSILNDWLKKAQKDDLQDLQQKYEEKICHICKQKQTKANRFVFLANFTRNNVVSTLLKSEVTDLDINICLHKIHENCYDKVTQKGKCPLCKFEVNCYIPEKPLPDQSYTKNWLRNFQNIITKINLDSGKSFNSDWATIFLTYLVFSRSFKMLLKSTQVQTKQIKKIDALLMLHLKNQLDKWPELTKQTIKKADKTVKGQVRRQSNIKKAVKSLALDLILQQITQEPFKNQKRIEKKIRQLVNFIGQKNSQKVCQSFQFCRNKQSIKQILQQSISDQDHDQKLFKIRQFPKDAKKYLQTTSIKCPMCGKYQPSTWECLFCQKISCQNCISVRNHCERDHRGSAIVLYLNNAEYKLIHENRQIQKDSLYRNEFSQGWTRDQNPEGWKCCTDEISNFFDSILHSLNVKGNKNTDNDSDDGRQNFGFGWNPGRTQFQNFGGNSLFGNTTNNMFSRNDEYEEQPQENLQEEEQMQENEQEDG